MGQSIVVHEKPSSIRGIVRFETNRALTGMGHERYRSGDEVWGERPPDELARRLLARESVAGLQINGNVVTVDLEKGYDSSGLLEVIEDLYRFYPDAPATTPAVEAPEAPEAADGEAPGDAPADDASADDVPADEQPVEVVPAPEGVPADEVPVEAVPVPEDVPADDAPVELAQDDS